MPGRSGAGGAGGAGDHRRRLGARGEQAAADWYLARGYHVVARNWRCRDGELDLVLWSTHRDLVFCEVKTRSSTRFGLPVEAVTPAKQRRLRRLAALFVVANAEAVAGRHGLRFDVASVTGGRVEVIEAAF